MKSPLTEDGPRDGSQESSIIPLGLPDKWPIVPDKRLIIPSRKVIDDVHVHIYWLFLRRISQFRQFTETKQQYQFSSWYVQYTSITAMYESEIKLYHQSEMLLF